jgi:hypothetical protein
LSVSLPLRLHFENPLLRNLASEIDEKRSLTSGEHSGQVELLGMLELLDSLER